MRLLLVEDDADVSRLLRDALVAQGHDVVLEGTAHDGLAAVESGAFDVLVTDLGLPDASGSVVCAAGAEKGLRVVVITANPKLADVPPIRDCADAVLAKPFQIRDLLAAIGSDPA